MRAKTLLAICIVGGLSMVRADVANALTTDMNFQFTGVANPISADFAILFSTQGASQAFEGYAPLATIPAGDSMQSIILAPAGSSQTVPAGIEGSTPIDAVAIIGVYTSNTSAQGITLGVSPLAATLGAGQSYATVTSQISPLFPDEATLVSNLQNLSQADIAILLSKVGTPIAAGPALITVGGDGTFLSFSNGTLSGSLSVSISTPTGPPTVPVPAAGWMAAITLALIAGAAAVRRRYATA
jgi:hypothetical protein